MRGGWTQEDHAMLAECVANGMTAQQASKAFGERHSRNAIIGMAARCRLRWKLKSGWAPRTKNVPAQHKLSVAPSPSHEGARGAAEPRPRLVSIPLLGDLWLTFETLEAGQCRFPLGDGDASDFLFCGAPQAPGHSYCAHHNALAYAWRRAPVRAPSGSPRLFPAGSTKFLCEETL